MSWLKAGILGIGVTFVVFVGGDQRRFCNWTRFHSEFRISSDMNNLSETLNPKTRK